MATKKKPVVNLAELEILLGAAIRIAVSQERDRRGAESGAIADGRAGAFDAVREYLKGNDHLMKVYAGL